MRKCAVILLLGCCFILNCTSSKHVGAEGDTLSAKNLLPYGRYVMTDDGRVELISSAVHFGFQFQGRTCQLFASVPAWLDHNYLQYEIDGVYQRRIRISNDSIQPIVIAAPDDRQHEVWIYKATEAHTGPVYIQKIVGNRVKPLPNSNAPLIEFIGNSITCGAASDTSEVRCGAGVYHDQHNAYYAYGPRAARNLGVNYILSSVSGIGIYRNWNSDSPTMPEVYEKIDFQDKNTQLWNFSKYNPKIVSIALGTNDFSNGDGKRPRLPFDSSVFVDTYVKFVKLVKQKYPAAKILLLNTPMIGGERKQIFENCLEAVKTLIDHAYPANKPVSLFFFKPMRAGGCTGHPSIADHAILADELAPFLRKLLSEG
jgi:lysophospholipase L1-like esterase